MNTDTRSTESTSSSPRSPLLLRASGASVIVALAIGMAFGGWHPAPTSKAMPASVDPTFEQAVVPASPEGAALPADEVRPAPATPAAPPNSRRDEFDDGSETIWPGQIAG
ncbi:MAG: hypothetical protein ACK5TK_00675 [Betaproteobacteria bacterium]